ncbi:MerR family transcriptional regulator [Nocardia sp. NPDC052316]|uniref:helix-turn-helix domain-containing protein n=1 Tax=Nocardia sp. NPDC052316 TaxID=3364329 RepID=UPI0037CC3243
MGWFGEAAAVSDSVTIQRRRVTGVCDADRDHRFAHAASVPVNGHMKSSAMVTIGDLAQRFGLGTHVLRYWESLGLLEPARRKGGQRLYDQTDLERVALILMGKEAGLTLGQLATVLSTADPMEHRELLCHHVEELERRIAQAQAAKELIQHALACPRSMNECEHAREHISARIPPLRPGAPGAPTRVEYGASGTSTLSHC